MQNHWNADGFPRANKIPVSILDPNNIVSLHERFGDKIDSENIIKLKMKMILSILRDVARVEYTTDFGLLLKTPVFIVDDNQFLNSLEDQFVSHYFIAPNLIEYTEDESFLASLVNSVTHLPEVRKVNFDFIRRRRKSTFHGHMVSKTYSEYCERKPEMPRRRSISLPQTLKI